jgi:cytochrome c oxidase assembly factor CtaG
MHRVRARTIILVVLAGHGSAYAHVGRPQTLHDLWGAWDFEPGVVLGLVVAGVLYALGIAEFREAGLWGRAFRKWHGFSFLAGWFALVIALVSPLHTLGNVLFSAHMTQHEVLMLIAAPLIVLGRPIPVFLKALPRGSRVPLLRLRRVRALRAVSKCFSSAPAAWLIHAVALWAWHIPFLFDATVEYTWVHGLQHVSFFGSALLFWWALFDGHQKRRGYGAAVLYVFTTAIHSGILGAMLTFAQSSWYSIYARTTQSWGISPVEDQQLGGLIMWIPASAIYIGAGLVLFAGWLRESTLRADEAMLFAREQAS